MVKIFKTVVGKVTKAVEINGKGSLGRRRKRIEDSYNNGGRQRKDKRGAKIQKVGKRNAEKT